MSRTILILVFSLFLLSCNRDDATKEKTDTQKNQSQHENGNDESDSTLTPEEAFSSALVQDIIGESDDIDLQVYLEEQIYPLASKSRRVTIDRVSSSLYLLSYDESGVQKNILIQKLYDPVNDEIVFEKSETQSDRIEQILK